MQKNTRNGDAEYVRALIKGDLNAFNQLFDKYNRKLFFFAKGYLQSAEDAEELVQEVFLKIWEGRSKLKDHLSFNAYLFTITYNAVLKHFRKAGRERKHLEQAMLYNDIYHDETSTSIEYKELLEITNKAIAKLPEKRREVFKLSRMEGLSNSEIAEQLQISKKTVENQIYQSLQFLKEQLKDERLVLLLFFALFLS